MRNVGVRSYAIANPDFPHQSTADQFFSELQFESYRALGFEITDGILALGTESTPQPGKPDAEGDCHDLGQTGRGKSPAVGTSRHCQVGEVAPV